MSATITPYHFNIGMYVPVYGIIYGCMNEHLRSKSDSGMYVHV